MIGRDGEGSLCLAKWTHLAEGVVHLEVHAEPVRRVRVVREQRHDLQGTIARTCEPALVSPDSIDPIDLTRAAGGTWRDRESRRWQKASRCMDSAGWTGAG